MVGRESPDFIADINSSHPSRGRRIALHGGEWRTALGVDSKRWSAMRRFEGAASGAIFESNIWLILDLVLPMLKAGKTFEVWKGGTKAWGCVKRLTALRLSFTCKKMSAIDPKWT